MTSLKCIQWFHVSLILLFAMSPWHWKHNYYGSYNCLTQWEMFWAVEWTIYNVKVHFWVIFTLLWVYPDGYKWSIFLYVTSLSMSKPLLWCEEVLATICLVFVDRILYFEHKVMHKWCSERKPTSPIKLPMLLDDDLDIGEG